MVQNQYMCLIMAISVFTYYNGNERMKNELKGINDAATRREVDRKTAQCHKR